MVKGLNVFRDYFRGDQDKYVLIGGAACYLAMDEVGLDFRVTKDLDIVLCIEAIDAEFVKKFWDFVRAGKYEIQQKSTGEKQYYRFMKPQNPTFPVMLELFSRQPDGLILEGEPTLTPIPTDEDVSSLSAILMDDNYYGLMLAGKKETDEVCVLDPETIVVFKAKAWLDLTARKRAGERVDSKNIKKHKNDVFRLFPLLSPANRTALPDEIKDDMRAFIAAVRLDPPVLSSLNVTGVSADAVFGTLAEIYQL
ncbi:MAG: hypothetical protein Q9N02_11925 [Ghiorsea sp.]|nr:hypothetical protein [Ghiorsea sp.]